MGTRTSRINALRGFCRELGLHAPLGARTGVDAMARVVADDQSVIPALLRPLMQQLLDEIRVARSVLRAAKLANMKGQELLGVRHWAITLQARSNHNKAACALAHKMARICYAVPRDHTPFGQPATRLAKKMQRQSFELAH